MVILRPGTAHMRARLILGVVPAWVLTPEVGIVEKALYPPPLPYLRLLKKAGHVGVYACT